jgi:hypothetical protein
LIRFFASLKTLVFMLFFLVFYLLVTGIFVQLLRDRNNICFNCIKYIQ